MNLVEKKVGNNLEYIGRGDHFLNSKTIVKALRCSMTFKLWTRDPINIFP